MGVTRRNRRLDSGHFFSARELKLVQFYALKAGEPLSTEEAKRRIRPKRLKNLHDPLSGRGGRLCALLVDGRTLFACR